MSMRIKNNKLLPFVLLDLIDLIRLNGQLIPKRTNMTTSNIFAAINISSLPSIQQLYNYFLIMLLFIYMKTKQAFLDKIIKKYNFLIIICVY